jgi:hypothetical protein
VVILAEPLNNVPLIVLAVVRVGAEPDILMFHVPVAPVPVSVGLYAL